jgi:ElaA protein
MDLIWKWSQLLKLSPFEVHAVLAARQSVFIMEQNCIYQDADDLDYSAWHLIGCNREGQLMAYLRVTPPGSRFPEPSIGRLLTIKPMRGKKIATCALELALNKCGTAYPGQSVRIAAQTYLVDFYNRFGFLKIGPSYKEDGIDHVDMLRVAASMG